jgi:hypothetical protein
MQPTSFIMKHACSGHRLSSSMQPTSFIMKQAAEIVHHEACSRHRSS